MIRVLVIGVGSIGERHLRCFQATGRAEVSLCELNADLRRTVAERYTVTRVFPSLDDALCETHDAAVIATPAPHHVPMALKLASAGWHLLIEKPLSTSLDGVDALSRIAAERELKVAVGYTWRSHPSLVAMREAIHSGRFGKPVQLIVSTGQHFPTFRPAYREIYFARHDQGGGAIQDGITHMLNAGEWLVGPIERLAADAAHRVLDGVDVEDTVNVITRQGDVLGSYAMNLHQAPNESTLTVVCERGTVQLETHRHRWRWITEPMPGGAWHDEPIEPFDRDYLYVAQANAFLDTMEGKGEPPCSLAEGVQTLKVNLAALRSVEEGRWVEV